MRARLTVWLCASMLAACGVGVPEVRSEQERDLEPDVGGFDVPVQGRRTRGFAYTLYPLAAPGDGNVVYSPWSLTSGLAMVLAGAAGETAEEMRSVLVLGERPHDVMNATLLSLDGTSVLTANAVWLAPGFDVRASYLDLLATRYGAGVFTPESLVGAEPMVNDWYAERTDGLISELVGPGTFSQDTALALTNAVSFEAEWAAPFPEAATRASTFETLGGDTVPIELMERRGNVRAARGDGWIAVRLPYADGSTVMLLLLPDEGRFREIEAQVPAGVLDDAWDESQRSEDLIVRVPRFDVSQDLDLGPLLAELGMRRVQDPQLADLSEMSSSPGLWVSEIRQRATVMIDERGTRAAAGTFVEVGVISLIEIVDFRRPFLFGIFDTDTQQPLFIGRVAEPA